MNRGRVVGATAFPESARADLAEKALLLAIAFAQEHVLAPAYRSARPPTDPLW
jgi:hypothetical protein